jgi:hypothetical protein
MTSNTEITGCSKPLDFGSVCEQTCSKGYEKVSGSSIRICKSDGSWSGEDLKCQEKSKRFVCNFQTLLNLLRTRYFQCI